MPLGVRQSRRGATPKPLRSCIAGTLGPVYRGGPTRSQRSNVLRALIAVKKVSQVALTALTC